MNIFSTMQLTWVGAFLLITCPLQYFLSKTESPYLGWILPVVSIYRPFYPSFLLSLILLSEGIWWASLISFLLAILPTVVLIVIYIYVRRKRKRNTETRQMEIRNL